MSGPTQYAGAYSLDLYCDVPWPPAAHDRFEGAQARTFIGETFADCARQARAAGWKLFKATRTARCPKCVAAKVVHP